MCKKIIFDTDLGGDCDDVLALAYFLSEHNKGNCNLLGVTYSADAKAAVACIHTILTQYGCGDIPIGSNPISEDTVSNADVYATAVAQAFSTPDTLTYDSVLPAVTLLRKLLAENGRVTLCVTGYLTNIAGLLLSQPDKISSLDGVALIKQHVDEIAIMGGNFSHQNKINPIDGLVQPDGTVNPIPEWNILCDIPAAKATAELSPVKTVFCPFELGFKMITGAKMVARDGKNTPTGLSYITHGSTNGRDSWDPATAVYALEGCGSLYDITPAGRVTIDDSGFSHFAECESGMHYYLKCRAAQQEIADYIDSRI